MFNADDSFLISVFVHLWLPQTPAWKPSAATLNFTIKTKNKKYTEKDRKAHEYSSGDLMRSLRCQSTPKKNQPHNFLKAKKYFSPPSSSHFWYFHLNSASQFCSPPASKRLSSSRKLSSEWALRGSAPGTAFLWQREDSRGACAHTLLLPVRLKLPRTNYPRVLFVKTSVGQVTEKLMN